MDFDRCGPATGNDTQTSSAGKNVYEASGNGGTITQTNGNGDNIIVCELSESVEGDPTSVEESPPIIHTKTDQSCDFTQDTTNGGNNLVVAHLEATHFYRDEAGVFELKQTANMELFGRQTATLTGANTVRGCALLLDPPRRDCSVDPDNPSSVPAADTLPVEMKISQTLESEPTENIPPQQTQERLTNLEIRQFAASGDNSVNYNLDSVQRAEADGLHPTQKQDTLDTGNPNARAVVHQTSVTGKNFQKGRGIDDKYARAQSIDSAVPFIGVATQHQWNTNGGFHIEGDQVSANDPSTSTDVIDFGQQFVEGTDCRTVDGFKKLGVIETFDVVGAETDAGIRSQRDRLPTIPGLPKSPDTATVGACSDLRAPAETEQNAIVSVDGHTRAGITGSIAADLRTSGGPTPSADVTSGGGASAYVAFRDQRVKKAINCTSGGCTTTGGGVTGSGDNVSAFADQWFTAQVAHFTNDDPSTPVHSAQIDWDENDAATPAPGTIGGTGNPFIVTGTHKYPSPGAYPIVVTLLDKNGTLAGRMRATAIVSLREVGIKIFGSNPNEGVQPVAIITTPDFNALTVKAESLRFGDCGDPPNTLATEVHGQVHPTDIAPQDGDLDGMTHFAPAAMMLEPGEKTACLYGQTKDGTKIFATGTIPKK